MVGGGDSTLDDFESVQVTTTTLKSGSRGLTVVGLVVTVLWLGAFVLLVLLRTGEAGSMTLNEWGDYLAGGSAPLALLWLVIGYFQHGRELRLNTVALAAQQEELRQQVAQTAHLAKNAGRQAQAAEDLAEVTRSEQQREEARVRREARLDIISHGGSAGIAGSDRAGREYKTKIMNIGADVRALELLYEGQHKMVLSCPDPMLSEHTGTLVLEVGSGEALEYPIKFAIAYTDRLENRRERKYELRGYHDLHPVE